MICDCPRGANIESVQLKNCPFEFGQLRMLVVQRVYNGTELNKIANPETFANWTAAKKATDSTKVVALPNVYAPSITPGDRQVFGENSNDTPDGAGIVMGEYATTVTGNFAQQSPDTIEQIKKLECEVLGVYLVNSAGKIVGKKDSTDGIKPIPIKAFFVKGYETGTMDNPTKNDWQFKMNADWYEDLKIVTPTDFDALLQLQEFETASN